MTTEFLGAQMHQLAAELFPICRSITGNGVRESLAILARHLPGLTQHEVPTGTQCFDWPIPDEWNIKNAYILGPDGEKVVDFKDSNLHVVSYSIPVDCELDLEELQQHLHSIPERPHAIPYVTSYYKRTWGFCLPHVQREKLNPGRYRVVIDSTLSPGAMSYADLLIPGETQDEILLSTYVCHPSLANNELSGPVVATFLAKWILSESKRRYSYRIVFVPEAIGAIAYISRNLTHLRQRVRAGYVISCVGDDRAYSYLASPDENTLADRAARHSLKHVAPDYRSYSFLQRGSDERQYCSPGVELPVASIMRTRYGDYPEYHCSDDNLDLVTPTGLWGGYMAIRRAIETIEANRKYRVTTTCEPFLGSRNLYPALGAQRKAHGHTRTILNLCAYSDGRRDLVDIAERLDIPVWDLVPLVEQLRSADLLQPID